MTERGHPVATITPYTQDDAATQFARRRESPEFKSLPIVDGDSSVYISDDRDRS